MWNLICRKEATMSNEQNDTQAYFLNAFLYGKGPAREGEPFYTLTTEEIHDQLSKMCEISYDEINELMQRFNFTVRKNEDGSIGWAYSEEIKPKMIE